MKNFLCLIIVVAALLSISCKQTPDASRVAAPKALPNLDGTNFINADGHKQGHWIILNETEHLPGYKESDKVREGDYKDGKKEGIWIEYEPGGVITSKTEYKDDSVVKVIALDAAKK
jgi:hypothetical protein